MDIAWGLTRINDVRITWTGNRGHTILFAVHAKYPFAIARKHPERLRIAIEFELQTFIKSLNKSLYLTEIVTESSYWLHLLYSIIIDIRPGSY